MTMIAADAESRIPSGVGADGGSEAKPFAYQVGGALYADDPSYVVREADQDLYDSLKAGKFCYVFNSRQMGKSSLKVRVKDRLAREGIACAEINFQQIGVHNLSVEQWYLGILRSLVRSLGLQDRVDLRQWWQEWEYLSPMQRVGEFIDQLLLEWVEGPVVIFVDEIDSVLSLKFSAADLFAYIRECLIGRTEKPVYERLTFALFGVTDPNDLISDPTRTPFNVGHAVELAGFRFEEAQILGRGLAERAEDPVAVVREVVAWTGGQPFLTQRICQLIREGAGRIPTGREEERVEAVIRSQVIAHWEDRDEGSHFKTIRQRILGGEDHEVVQRLGIYLQALRQEGIRADDRQEQMDLRLAGLVVQRQGRIQVYNRIYAGVFSSAWIEQALQGLRPYALKLSRWIASGFEDPSCLLQGEELDQALRWSAKGRLGDLDYRFLTASQDLEKQELREENQILEEAKQKAGQMIRFGSGFLAASIAGLTAVGLYSWHRVALLQEAREGIRLERAADSALDKFDQGYQLEGLLTAVKAAQDLHQWTDQFHPFTRLDRWIKGQLQTRSLYEYPAARPIRTAHLLRNRIQEKNRLIGHQAAVNSASFSPDGQSIVTASRDTSARVWDLQGNTFLELTGHQADVISARFSPDGQSIVTTSWDGTAQIHPIPTLEELLIRACTYLQDYLNNPATPATDKQVCDDVEIESPQPQLPTVR